MLAVSTPSRSRPRLRLRLERVSPGARRQMGLFLLAYLVYTAARWVTEGDLTGAKEHAQWIVDLENDAGVAVEASVQRAFEGTWALWLLNHLYLAAQLIVLPGALMFLYRRSRDIYFRLRNTILVTWLLSVPVYALFPVAPPRLADVGLVDTISAQTGFAMDSKLTTSFYNELAAVPSLHVGFAVAIGIALAAALPHPLARSLALLWGPAIGLAVVVTGNHYVFDIVAGVAISIAGWVIGTAGLRPSGRSSAPSPSPSPSLRPTFAGT